LSIKFHILELSADKTSTEKAQKKIFSPIIVYAGEVFNLKPSSAPHFPSRIKYKNVSTVYNCIIHAINRIAEDSKHCEYKNGKLYNNKNEVMGFFC
jgi:hypothetical protein